MQPSLLSGAVWLSLPQLTRAKIAELFSLTKSGNVQVFNGPNGSEVRSDGYTYEDLSVITVESMQVILGSTKEDFYALFKDICRLVGEEVLEQKIEEDIAEAIVEEQRVEQAIPEVKERFCDSCTSKGGRHMKICPKASKYEKGTA